MITLDNIIIQQTMLRTLLDKLTEKDYEFKSGCLPQFRWMSNANQALSLGLSLDSWEGNIELLQEADREMVITLKGRKVSK